MSSNFGSLPAKYYMPGDMNFREFLNNTTAMPAHNAAPQAQTWRLDKDQLMQYWQQLSPSEPIYFDPIETGKRGSTFGEDGLRLTGSRRFIDSILGRLKDIMQYENPATKLNVAYRQVQYKGNQSPDKTMSFVFYAQAKSRDKPKQETPGVPHGSNQPKANTLSLSRATTTGM